MQMDPPSKLSIEFDNFEVEEQRFSFKNISFRNAKN